MKREGWTPEYLTKKIDEYIATLPTRDDYVYKRAYKQFKAGDLKKEKLEEEKERMERLRAAVNEFDKFQQLMRTRNRYDFDDMINWVLRAFEEDKNLLAHYQEEFQYILVDEYQDTSGTQNRLVELLISFWENPNVFVVGDDDQSIYRFQGANVENMEEFMKAYTDLLVVVLENNYRSTQPILDLSKSLIERNAERLILKRPELNLSKNLVSSNEKVFSLKYPPQLKEYETQREEMIDLTLQVNQLLQQGVLPGRIAVIYKENRYGEDLAQYFKARNIPVYSRRSLNILDIPLAQKILLLIKYLAAEHDVPYAGDEMLFEILHFDWFNIPPMEIAKLTVEASGRQSDLSKNSLRRHLYEKASKPPADLFSQGIHSGLQNASKVIERLIAAVPNFTLQSLLEKIIREAGVLNFIMQHSEKPWLLQVLTGLFDFVKDETHRNPSLKLAGLVTIIELMEKEELTLPLVRVSGTDKGVNLLTAHGSKGLEFEHVFFAGCNASFWEKKHKPGGGYKLPDTIFSTLAKTDNESPEELRRLFYVALTRAEQHLIISYSRFRNDGKEMEPSLFIAELQEGHPLPAEKVFISEEVLTEYHIAAFSEPEAPEIAKMEEDFVNGLLEGWKMYVTALNNYLRCPLEFYFKNLVRIPSPRNEATEFGSSVHHALQKLFEKMLQNNNKFPEREDFIADFTWYMQRHRESFTKEQFDRRLEYGHEVLTNYYDNYIYSWNRIVVVERNVNNVSMNGVPLKGKLDKLEFDGKRVNVVDYKTGDFEKAKPKLQPPNEKEPNGGDYWRQGVFYKILIDGNDRGWQVISTEFDFIEPDKKKNYRKEKITISPQDITTVSQQILTVWQKIQDHDFYTGCGKEDCHWCHFVKTNNMTVALHKINEEEPEGDF
jgi:DNA helicase-2/ATP-dependent DNA helicase PcrA